MERDRKKYFQYFFLSLSVFFTDWTFFSISQGGGCGKYNTVAATQRALDLPMTAESFSKCFEGLVACKMNHMHCG